MKANPHPDSSVRIPSFRTFELPLARNRENTPAGEEP